MSDLQDFYRVVEISDGNYFAGEIFRHKLGHELPDTGRHLIGCYRADAFRFVPLGYLQIGRHDTVGLVGGGCTDGRAFDRVDSAHAVAIREAGGVLFSLLRYAFTRMTDDFEAFFGYCGDARAEEVDLAAGFEYTKYKYLLAHFHRPVDSARREALTDQVYRLGPF